MVKAVITFILKIIFQGLYGRMMARIEEEAESKKQGAIQVAKTTEESAKVEIEVEKAKEVVREKYANLPENPDDPFHTDQWNAKK